MSSQILEVLRSYCILEKCITSEKWTVQCVIYKTSLMDKFGQMQTNFVLVIRERVLSSNLKNVLGKLTDIFK